MKMYIKNVHRILASKLLHNYSVISGGATDCNKLMKETDLIYSLSPGIHCLLPSVVRSLDKLVSYIEKILMRDMLDAQKVILSTLAPAQLWKKSGRLQNIGAELFRIKDRHGFEFCLCPTHEETITSMISSIFKKQLSTKRLPLKLYQTTWKFRDEMTPRTGLLRAREFLMNDLYTFDKDMNSAVKTYDEVCVAYGNLFELLQLNAVKVIGTSGNIGGNLSHEYHLISDAGEDVIYLCNTCHTNYNVEYFQAMKKEKIENNNDHYSEASYYDEEIETKCPKCRSNMISKTSIEIGHSFLLEDKYSKPFSAMSVSSDGLRLLQMGCYGIGVSRLLAAAIQVHSNVENGEAGVRWPLPLAPYLVAIIPQKKGYKSDVTDSLSQKLYDHLSTNVPILNDNIILDDRTNHSIGRRLFQQKQLGIPFLIILGKRALEDSPKFELINMSDEITDGSLFTMCELTNILRDKTSQLVF